MIWHLRKHYRKPVIIKQVKRDQNIIYGARAIQAQTGLLGRPTKDYDIYSDGPKKSAEKLQKSLDKAGGGNFYYSKPGKHRGTFKVKSVGPDAVKGTKDDEGIADFTKPERKISFVTIGGVRYAKLSEEVKNKKRSLRDPASRFRHQKDAEDLARIRAYKRMRGW